MLCGVEKCPPKQCLSDLECCTTCGLCLNKRQRSFLFMVGGWLVEFPFEGWNVFKRHSGYFYICLIILWNNTSVLSFWTKKTYVGLKGISSVVILTYLTTFYHDVMWGNTYKANINLNFHEVWGKHIPLTFCALTCNVEFDCLTKITVLLSCFHPCTGILNSSQHYSEEVWQHKCPSHVAWTLRDFTLPSSFLHMNSGHSPEMSFHTCSTQQVIVCVRHITANSHFGLGEGWWLGRAYRRYDVTCSKTTVFCLKHLWVKSL